MARGAEPRQTGDGPHFEHVSIPPGQSFLWRKDHYPWRLCEWNYHPECEVHLLNNASGLTYIGDHVGHFTDGHLFLVGGNLPHTWFTPLVGGSRILDRDVVVQFDFDRIVEMCSAFPEFSSLQTLLKDAARGLEFHGCTAVQGAEMLQEMGNCSSGEALAILLRFLVLAATSREYKKLASEHFVQNARFEASQDLMNLDKTIEFLNRNFMRSISIKDVAKLVDMPISTFSRFFKLRTGSTYSDHLRSLRIWTAKQLLETTETSITDVCFESGFGNISNFNRTFLRITGLTPSQYRRALHQRAAMTILGTGSASSA